MSKERKKEKNSENSALFILLIAGIAVALVAFTYFNFKTASNKIAQKQKLVDDIPALILKAGNDYRAAVTRQFKLLEASDTGTVRLSAEYLACLRPPMFIECLGDKARNSTGEVALEIALTAAIIDDGTCQAHLRSLSKGDDPEASTFARAALYILHGEGDTAELATSFRNSRNATKIAIARLLGIKSSPFYTPLLVEVYSGTGEAGIESIRTDEVAIAAARAVWKTGDYSSLKVIMEYAQSKKPSERTTGYEALSLHSDPAAYAFLKRGVEDPDPTARICAILSLYDSIQEEAIPEFAKKLARATAVPDSGVSENELEKRFTKALEVISGLNRLARTKNVQTVEIVREQLKLQKPVFSRTDILKAVAEMKNNVALDYQVLEEIIRIAREGDEEEKKVAADTLRKLIRRYNELP